MSTENKSGADNKSAIEEKPEIIKPCPFCGGEATIEQNARNGYKIGCKKCVVYCQQRVIHNSMEWLKGKMIQDWNKRVSPSPVQGMDATEGWKEKFKHWLTTNMRIDTSKADVIISHVETYIRPQGITKEGFTNEFLTPIGQQTEQKLTLGEFLKSNPKALKEALDIWDKAEDFRHYYDNRYDGGKWSQDKQQYFRQTFNIDIK